MISVWSLELRLGSNKNNARPYTLLGSATLIFREESRNLLEVVLVSEMEKFYDKDWKKVIKVCGNLMSTVYLKQLTTVYGEYMTFSVRYVLYRGLNRPTLMFVYVLLQTMYSVHCT